VHCIEISGGFVVRVEVLSCVLFCSGVRVSCAAVAKEVSCGGFHCCLRASTIDLALRRATAPPPRARINQAGAAAGSAAKKSLMKQ
jgi:hypothetical protein